MKRAQFKISILSFIIIVQLVVLPCSSFPLEDLGWAVGDTFTWEYSSYSFNEFTNETVSRTDWHFSFHNFIELEVLSINELDELVSLQESTYLPNSPDPLIVDELYQSFVLSFSLGSEILNRLFLFFYYFDEATNESSLGDIVINDSWDYFEPLRLCEGKWSMANSFFRQSFDSDIILTSVNGSLISFGDFLATSTFTLMGVSNHTQALDLMFSPNSHWSASFDYSSALTPYYATLSSIVEYANATFNLQYSPSGVLENYLLQNSLIIQQSDNSTIYHKRSINYTLVDSTTPSEPNPYIVPSILIGVSLIIIVILLVRVTKHRKK